jgi:O-antigen ligase
LLYVAEFVGCLLVIICIPVIAESVIINPRRLLYLLAVLIPIPSIALLTVYDIRLWCAIYLAIRAAFVRGTGPMFNWRITTGVVLFFLIAEGGVLLYSGRIPPEDVAQAQVAILYTFGTVAFAFAATRLLTNEQEVLRALLCSGVVTAGIALHAMYLAYVSYAGGENQRVGSVFLNANSLGSYLGITVIALFQIGRLQTGKSRVTCFTIAALCLPAILITWSRSSIAAVLMGLLVVWALRDGRLRMGKAVLALGIALIVALAVGSYVRSLRVSLGASDATAAQSSRVELAQTAEDYTRLEAAQYSLELWSQHVLFGVGLGTLAAFNYQANGIYVTTHNTILEILVGSGIVGFLCILFVLREFWVKLERRSKLLMAPLLVCFAANSLFGEYVQAFEFNALLFLAYLYCYRHERVTTGGFSVAN